MTLASSTLQIRRHEYSRELNIIIFVGISTLLFYAINMDVVSLFANSSFLFLANLYCIDVLRGVTVRFGSVFGQKNIWTNKIFIGSVFTVFEKRNRSKLTGLVRIGSVRFISLFENTIKKNYIFTNLYFMHTTYSNISWNFVFHLLCFSNNSV